MTAEYITYWLDWLPDPAGPHVAWQFLVYVLRMVIGYSAEIAEGFFVAILVVAELVLIAVSIYRR